MILVLAGGGRESEEVIGLLEKEKVPCLCVFSTLAEAGSYGRGNAVIGKMDSRLFKKIFEENTVWGVVDAFSGAEPLPSLEAMSACREERIPYVKYLRIPSPEGLCPQSMVVGSYAKIAAFINTRLGAVLFDAAPGTVRAVAKQVLDRKSLYVSVLRTAAFDVEQALEYGIPLMNVLETNGAEDDISRLMDRLDIQMLVCDGTADLADRAKTAEKRKIPLIITHQMGIEYTNTALQPEELRKVLQGWRR